jgi:hypothetical protein
LWMTQSAPTIVFKITAEFCGFGMRTAALVLADRATAQGQEHARSGVSKKVIHSFPVHKREVK